MKNSPSSNTSSLTGNQEIDLLLTNLSNTFNNSEELENLKHLFASEIKNHLQVKLMNKKLFNMYSSKLDEIEQLNSNLSVEIEKKVKELIIAEKFSNIGKLTSVLAHDIRNPLAVLQAIVTNLEMKDKDDKKYASEVKRLYATIDRINEQITDTLNYLKDTELVLNTISLQTCINEAISIVKIPEEIRVKVSQNDETINGDFHKLEMVFSNLIKNSIDSIGDKSGEISIDISNDETDISVIIYDSGPALSDLNKIFEPLFTTKTTGTGLGLPSCKSIIELHGGTITASNDPKKFIITLPQI
ncbi:sensor histidine kinase [Nitrosopumilus adriaticus]|uniref:Sensor protein n=1 Tax=Nitrosopumilus adriaticus TaxID=1580092 RepID=A0A0D5C3B6_9ARCH|nr:HAMP domain-containing sensor histidine kinase [Nitrosopumilus adriaticus]AJW71289.1 Sensor protein [Nitrosopumilus adriaticus]